MSELQDLVDALAAAIDRPVGVDDRRFRAMAYSSHLDGVDPVRLASILQREAPREVTTWLESLGIRDAEEFVRVPANARFGMAARVCMPLRFDGALLGYLWLIDEPTPLSDAELAECRRFAAEVDVVLYRARLLEHDDRERERELVAGLAGRRPDAAPAAAAAELVRDGFLAVADAYAVLVAHAVHASGREPPDEVRVRLAAAAERVRRGVAPRHLLVLVAGEHIVCVLSCADASELPRRADALSFSATEMLADTPGWSAVIGVGAEVGSAAELPASHVQALRAVRVGRGVDGLRPVVHWSELGAYRTLVGLLGDRDPLDALPSRFRRLLASADAEALVDTLERYLDRGGDARAAAQSLHIHRSSLYGRLHRIEEIARVDLRSGDDRLELHLAIRLWRLGGCPTSVASASPNSRQESVERLHRRA